MNQKRKMEMKRRRDQIIVEAWKEAKRGKNFLQALEERGYRLASGYTGIVVIDPKGIIFNPLRHLPGVSAETIRKMVGPQSQTLPDATALSREVQRQQQEPKANRNSQQSDKGQLLDRLQHKHMDERAATFDRLTTRIEKEQERLAEYYQLEEQAEKIKLLEEKAANPSLWKKIRSVDKTEREEINELHGHLHCAKQLMDGKIQFLESERGRTMEEMSVRHHQEREALKKSGVDMSLCHAIPNPARNISELNPSDRDLER